MVILYGTSDKTLRMNTLITQDRLDSIVQLLKQAPKEGLIAEIGVYKGGSLKVIAEAVPNRAVVGFDTFEGLPESQWSEDEIHKPGDFSDITLEAVQHFLQSNTNVTLVKGLFPESGEEYKDAHFAFVHIDTDFYEAVKQSLDFVWPMIIKGGIVVFDDYQWGNCPGVKKALEEFGEPVLQTKAKWQAYIVKP